MRTDHQQPEFALIYTYCLPGARKNNISFLISGVFPTPTLFTQLKT